MNIIKTYNLSKHYKNIVALSDVSVTVDEGQIYGLIGKNGAGKTTLMRMLCGLSLPTSGSFSLFGQISADGLTAARADIGAIVEAPVLYPNMSATQNIQVMSLLKGIDHTRAAGDALEFAGLTGVGHRKVKNFSLGMKQRLAIAIALLNRPRLLILDEPANGLDPVGIVEMRNMLQNINRELGITMVISSHILTELSHLATHYGIIHKGELAEEVSAGELMSRLVKKLNIVLADKADTQKAVQLLRQRFGLEAVIEGDTLVIEDSEKDNRSAQINKEFALADILIKSISFVSADLESYFIDITRRM